MRKSFYISIFLLVFALILSAPKNTFAAEKSLVNLVKQIRPAVVLILTYDAYQRPIGSGSGFIVSPSGHIITNHHVIANASYAVVIFDKYSPVGGKKYIRASLVTTNPTVDVAVLKVNLTGLPYLDIDYREPEIGENIIIVGYPLVSAIGAYDVSVSTGILTSKKQISGQNFLQTNASVNPGNSGGPLISVDTGKVIGIVRMKPYTSEGINFCIPITEARSIIEQGKTTATPYGTNPNPYRTNPNPYPTNPYGTNPYTPNPQPSSNVQYVQGIVTALDFATGRIQMITMAGQSVIINCTGQTTIYDVGQPYGQRSMFANIRQSDALTASVTPYGNGLVAVIIMHLHRGEQIHPSWQQLMPKR